jgi:hypothetical protein
VKGGEKTKGHNSKRKTVLNKEKNKGSSSRKTADELA